MKIIYFGTPDFSVPSLEALIEKYEVVGVVTQLDKPKGRSSKLIPSPVKECAMKHGIPVYQYKRIRKEGIDDLKSLNADVMVTCAYGQILSKEILDMTPHGVINIHGSILPKYRGAAPIQWAIIDGEKTTGITILKSDVGIDDGPTMLFKYVDILENETSDELFTRLSYVGKDAILEALEIIERGEAVFTPQEHDKATVCKMLDAGMSKLDFTKPSRDIVNMIHGISGWPTAHIVVDGVGFKVYRAKVIDEATISHLLTKSMSECVDGEVVVASNKKGLVVKASDGYILLDEICPDSGKRMKSTAYLNGKKVTIGAVVE